ncbi:MAG: hypothetical protein VX871_05600 [Pseudomonadota bacterium]|nr:hypothetical protein [Pseudomonadota bacterium]
MSIFMQASECCDRRTVRARPIEQADAAVNARAILKALWEDWLRLRLHCGMTRARLLTGGNVV